MTIKQALTKIGDLLKIEFQKTIDSVTSNKATGALKNSVQYTVKTTDDAYQLQREMNQYGNYVDSGVRGTETAYRSNPASFFKQGQFRSKAISPKSGLPFPARIVIARNGLKPRPFINPSISEVMNTEGYDILTEAAVEEATIMMSNELIDINLG